MKYSCAYREQVLFASRPTLFQAFSVLHASTQAHRLYGRPHGPHSAHTHVGHTHQCTRRRVLQDQALFRGRVAQQLGCCLKRVRCRLAMRHLVPTHHMLQEVF